MMHCTLAAFPQSRLRPCLSPFMNLTDTSFTLDPCHRAAEFQRKLAGLAQQLRDSGGETGEPKAQALFETAAEVLSGLGAAFAHYARQSERAMMEPVLDIGLRSPRQENL